MMPGGGRGMTDEPSSSAQLEFDARATSTSGYSRYCSAQVTYEPLSACEARILGLGNRAIIASTAIKRTAPTLLRGA